MKFDSKIKVSGLLLLVFTLFSACKEKAKDSTSATSDIPATTTSSNVAASNNDIVYVNIDTLMDKYEYFKDSQKKLESQFETSQKQIDNKMASLQQKYVGYQQRAQEMTRQQLEEAEKTLGAEQEALMKNKDQLSKSLAKAEEDLNLQLKNKINVYLESLAKKNGYKFILSYNTTGLGVLYGDKSLEITNLVVSELNEAYRSDKEKK